LIKRQKIKKSSMNSDEQNWNNQSFECDVCGCFILARHEALPAIWGKLSLFARSPLHIATCTDKIEWTTLTCASLDPDPLWSAGAKRQWLDRIRFCCTCEIAWRVNLCAQEILFIRSRSSADGWWRVAILRVASSLSCPLSTPVQRPDRRDKGRPGTCSPMFINNPRRTSPDNFAEPVRLETDAGDSASG